MQYYVIDPVSSDPPKHRPLERFWPYADLPEQPTDEELAALDPDLHEALFGARPRPFSITLVFAHLDTPNFPAAPEPARASAEFRETGAAPRRYRAILTTDAPVGESCSKYRCWTRPKSSSTIGRSRMPASCGCRSSGSSFPGSACASVH
jgi:hypothetical protein